MAQQRLRGRPVLGSIFGLLLGIAVAADLLLLGAFALDSAMVVVLPIVFLVLGLLGGLYAPLGYLRR